MVRTRGRGRSAAGSRAAGNKGMYLATPGGYPFNGFRGYYPAIRPGWYGESYGKRPGRQEVFFALENLVIFGDHSLNSF